MTLAEVLKKLKEKNDERRALDKAIGDGEPTAEQRAQWDALTTEVRTLDNARARLEDLQATEERYGAQPGALRAAGAGGSDADPGDLDLSRRDLDQFSVLRLMRALANPTDRRAQEAAGFELECSAEIQRKQGRQGGQVRGVTIPTDILRAPVFSKRAHAEAAASIVGINGAMLRGPGGERRDLLVGTPTLGGNTVATDLLGASFIEILRNRISVLQLGATMLGGLEGNVAIPRQTGAAAIAWVTEGNAPTESQQAFDQVTMNPKTAAAFVDVSRRMLLQSSIDVEAFVRRDLAAIMALAIDLAALNGSGTAGQPRGVLQTAGINSIPLGTNGAAIAWTNIVQMETEVAVDNADAGTMAYLTNARQRGTAKTTQKFASTNGDPIWDRDNTVNGYRAAVSNQVPGNLTKGSGTNLSAWLFGNFANLLVGMWGGLDLLVDPYTSSTTGTVRFVEMQDVDVALRRVESFCAITDAI